MYTLAYHLGVGFVSMKFVNARGFSLMSYSGYSGFFVHMFDSKTKLSHISYSCNISFICFVFHYFVLSMHLVSKQLQQTVKTIQRDIHISEITYCSLVTSYGDIYLGQIGSGDSFLSNVTKPLQEAKIESMMKSYFPVWCVWKLYF